jgi:hypothetical protein
VRTVSRQFLSSLLLWLSESPEGEGVGLPSALRYSLKMGCLDHLTSSIDQTPDDHFQVRDPSLPSLALPSSALHTSQRLENLFSLVTTLLLQSSSLSSSDSSSSLQSSLLSFLMSYALRSIQSEIQSKTCLALDSISALLSSNQSSSSHSIIELLLQPQSQAKGSLSPLLAALQAILLARSQKKEVGFPSNPSRQSSGWVFDIVCSIIEKVLSTQSSPSLHLEILCLCGTTACSPYLVEDLVTVVYTALLHCPDSSECWNLQAGVAQLEPLHDSWQKILSEILSLLFSSPSTTPSVAVFKAGWIISLIVNKVPLLSLLLLTPPSGQHHTHRRDP